jgi:hypothetical protein
MIPPRSSISVQAARRPRVSTSISLTQGGTSIPRFVYSDVAGPWRTALDVGMRVFRGVPVGRLGSRPILAPLDGILRGIARDDSCERQRQELSICSNISDLHSCFHDIPR